MDSIDREFDVPCLRTLHPFDATRVFSRRMLGSSAIPWPGARVEIPASL